MSTENKISSGALNSQRIQKPSRKFACILCRRRKLKCDGGRPKCMTCQRLGHACGYGQEPSRAEQRAELPSRPIRSSNTGSGLSSQPSSKNTAPTPSYASTNALVPLGLHETLPAQHIMDELNDLYFERVHIFMPMLHKARFLSSSRLPPSIGPPACLRYAVWALTAASSQKYQSLEEAFYLRARRYAEADEMNSFGVSILTVEHVQCWSLLSQYETQKMCFPRAFMSVGRSARLAQMLGLHQVDKENKSAKQILPPARDQIDVEIRRRAFWSAFLVDRWATSGTGWPVIIDVREIFTRLPCSEGAFLTGTVGSNPTLKDIRRGIGVSEISTFAATIIIADLLGRIREHLHLESPDDFPIESQISSFWKCHNELDNDISSLFLSLPKYLRVPAGIRNPDAIFINMNLHSLSISLHQIAITTAEKHSLDISLVLRSRERCYLAAEEIVNILRLISHLELSKVNPFTSFSLYLAGATFLQSAKNADGREQSLTNLQFIRSALRTLKDFHPITGSFLLQLELDIEASRLLSNDESDFQPIGKQTPPSAAAEESPVQTTMADELDRYEVLPISLLGIVPPKTETPQAAQSTPASELFAPEAGSSASASDVFGQFDSPDFGAIDMNGLQDLVGIQGLENVDYGFVAQDTVYDFGEEGAMGAAGAEELDWMLGPEWLGDSEALG